jgi:GT2 family glycosyltransferase
MLAATFLTRAGRSQDTSSAQSVLLICVKYRADEETQRYLESIQSLKSDGGLHVMVVENTIGSSWAKATRSDCQAVQAPDNLGYFGGARYGLSLYREQNPLPDWVIISNVDLCIDDLSFLQRLALLASMPNLGAVAPKIQSSLTGVDQNPYMWVRPSALRMHFYKWLFRSWLILNAYEVFGNVFHRVRGGIARVWNSSAPASREAIYAPHGSFLIFSRNYFDRGGTLDFPEFLFGEEIYIAETMRKLGLDVVYEPSLQVTHQEHHSTKLFKSRAVAQHLARSAAYCADTLFPTPGRTKSD